MSRIMYLIIRVLKIIYRLIYFATNGWRFRHLHWTAYVSPGARVANHKGISIGPKVVIHPGATLWTETLSIEEGVYINPGTCIYGKVSIGNYSMIAPNCMIAGGNHGFKVRSEPMARQDGISKGITIGADVWIGANCSVLDGVKINKGAIVGAGAVVTKDITEYSLNVGNPSRQVGMRP